MAHHVDSYFFAEVHRTATGCLRLTFIGGEVAVSDVLEQKDGKDWTLLYFTAPTRGEQLSLLFHLAETPFASPKIDFPKGLNPYKSSSTLFDKAPLMFDQCPALIHKGTVINQTAACMQYAGEELGFAPKGSSCDRADALAVLLGCEEMRNSVWYKLMLPEIAQRAAHAKAGGIAAGITRYGLVAPARLLGLAPSVGNLESACRKWMGHFERRFRFFLRYSRKFSVKISSSSEKLKHPGILFPSPRNPLPVTQESSSRLLGGGNGIDGRFSLEQEAGDCSKDQVNKAAKSVL